MGACCRARNQDEEGDETAYKQLGAGSRLLALALMGKHNSERKESRRFLECVNPPKGWRQVVREPACEGAPLDLWCAGGEGLVAAFGTLLSSSFQRIPLSLLLLLAWGRVEWGWHALQGMPGDLCKEWVFISALLSFAVLRPSEKDPEPMVRSGAVETTVMLTSRHTATSGRRFPLPCCR